MKRYAATLIATLVLCLAAAASAQLVFWTTEEQPERMDVQRQIAADFEAATGISVEVVPVTENQLGERITAAFAAGELPDVVFHPLERTHGWYEAGILDGFAASEVIENLGVDTFSAGTLNLVDIDGTYATVPSDGWPQLLVYRADLFEEEGLAPPTDYQSARAAIDALHDPPDFFGFVTGTDPSQVYMMQILEFFAAANGVSLVDAEGNVTLDTPAMVEALEFYKDTAEASPPGNLYWLQSREVYFAGDTAMIVWSPFILDELAGLRDDVPVTAFDDPTSTELAARTGIVTQFAGPNNPDGAGWAQANYLGITVDADTDAAIQFVEYMMSDAYLDMLTMAPEGKFPLRRGTADDADAFVEGWSNLQVGVDRRTSLADLYSEQAIDDLLRGLDTGTRWGYAHGEGLLVSRVYETGVLAELLREYLDGERTAEETASLMQLEVEALQD